MEGVQLSQIDVGGIRTAVRTTGDASCDHGVIVLLHDGAFGSDADLCWHTIMPELGRTHRVVAPDLLGYGGTSKLHDFESGPYFSRIRHVEALCDTLGIRGVHFVGASFGASLLLVALSVGDLPAASAVAICGAGGLYRRHDNFNDLYDVEPTRECAEKITSYVVGPCPGYDELIDRRFDNMFVPGHWECLQAAKLPGVPRDGDRIDVRDGLRETETPLLLVEGIEDRLLEAGWSERLAGEIGGAAAHTQVPGLHLPHLDHPAAVVTAVEEFIGRVPPEGAAGTGANR